MTASITVTNHTDEGREIEESPMCVEFEEEGLTVAKLLPLITRLNEVRYAAFLGLPVPGASNTGLSFGINVPSKTVAEAIANTATVDGALRLRREGFPVATVHRERAPRGQLAGRKGAVEREIPQGQGNRH